MGTHIENGYVLSDCCDARVMTGMENKLVCGKCKEIVEQ